ncbi:MAG: hypothetical protein AAFZ65_01140 [Planctomycetota bacterium]
MRTSQILRSSVLLATLAPVILAGCQSTGGPATVNGAVSSAQEEDSELGEHELAEKRWQLEQAELDLRSAEMDAELAMRKATRAVDLAAKDVQEAQLALKAFQEIEREHQLGEAQVGLQRQENRAVEARMELEELEAMYADDEFAGKTKELVLERGRRNLALTERSLELGRMQIELLSNTKLPMQTREHERKLQSAQQALEDARTELEQAKLDQERSLRKARHAIEKLEREIAEKVEA